MCVNFAMSYSAECHNYLIHMVGYCPEPAFVIHSVFSQELLAV